MSLLKRSRSNYPKINNKMTLFEEFDQFMEGRFGSTNLPDWVAEENEMPWQPRVDVAETNSAYEVTAELPGVKLKDIDLTLQDNCLHIKGEKRMPYAENKENYRKRETAYGLFSRAIPFAANIEDNKVRADLHDGVLNVHLQKSSEVLENTRKIEISH